MAERGRDTTIAASTAAGTEYVPVTFERCDHVRGPFFHGTRTAFVVGDEVVPGHGSNHQSGRVSNHVYFSALLWVRPMIFPLLVTRLGGSADPCCGPTRRETGP